MTTNTTVRTLCLFSVQDCEGAFAFAQMTRAVTAHLGNAADMTVRAAHAYRIR